MASCADIVNGEYIVHQNPPTDLSTCSSIILDGLEYQQLETLILIANYPINYNQSATAFAAVFIATFLYYLAIMQLTQFLDIANLVRRT